MEYPLFEVPLLGGGLLIGIVAIVHVFVSHFAVGGGMYLVLTERKAYKENSPGILKFVKDHTRFFVLLTLVFGAVTGAGIWFTIGLVHPAATSSLIHAFVWGWAIEWVFFFVEIAAAFCYYYSWEKVSKKVHLAIGWIYFIAAWLSLAVINGILSFMLTPGEWINSHGFWDGILNPTYLVSVIIRTAVAFILAGLYGLLNATRIRDDEETRDKLIRYNSRWLFSGLAAMPFAGAWYITLIPEGAKFISMGGAAAVTLFAAATIFLSALILIFTWLGPYRRPKEFTFTFAIMFMVLGFIVTGVTEWTREAVRKPYVISDYMYSNGFLVSENDNTWESVLARAKWSTVNGITPDNTLEAGRELFRLQCAACHVTDGYNGIKLLVYGWDKLYTLEQLKRLNTLKPFMPPVFGTDKEKSALAEYLISLNQKESGR